MNDPLQQSEITIQATVWGQGVSVVKAIRNIRLIYDAINGFMWLQGVVDGISKDHPYIKTWSVFFDLNHGDVFENNRWEFIVGQPLLDEIAEKLKETDHATNS